jgi:hypothetical protein
MAELGKDLENKDVDVEFCRSGGAVDMNIEEENMTIEGQTQMEVQNTAFIAADEFIVQGDD